MRMLQIQTIQNNNLPTKPGGTPIETEGETTIVAETATIAEAIVAMIEEVNSRPTIHQQKISNETLKLDCQGRSKKLCTTTIRNHDTLLILAKRLTSKPSVMIDQPWGSNVTHAINPVGIRVFLPWAMMMMMMTALEIESIALHQELVTCLQVKKYC